MRLSIVIAADVENPGAVERCVACLPADSSVGFEILVCRGRVGSNVPPGAREVLARPGASWNHLRAAGMRAARGDVVAVLSEDYEPAPGWIEQALESSREDQVVCGEVVCPQAATRRQEAAYLWEYLHVAAPQPPGVLDRAAARMIPAGQAIYRGAARRPDVLENTLSEMDFHQALYDAGVAFVRDPRLRAAYIPPEDFAGSRRRWSRLWAAQRAKDLSKTRRRLRGIGCLALPPVLLGRFILRLSSRRDCWMSAMRALPYFAQFAWAQAEGEMSAYLKQPGAG